MSKIYEHAEDIPEAEKCTKFMNSYAEDLPEAEKCPKFMYMLSTYPRLPEYCTKVMEKNCFSSIFCSSVQHRLLCCACISLFLNHFYWLLYFLMAWVTTNQESVVKFYGWFVRTENNRNRRATLRLVGGGGWGDISYSVLGGGSTRHFFLLTP